MKNRFKSKNSFSKRPKNLVFVALFMLASLALLTRLADYSRHVKFMTYSTFMKTVQDGHISSAEISGSEVFGRLKNGQAFEVRIADQAKVERLLTENNVDITYSQPQAQMSFWHLLLLFTLLGIPLVLWYFFRQSKGGGGGGPGNIFSMGKSKAKMFSPANIKVRFDNVAGAKDAKEELQDVVDFLKNPDKYKRLGAKITRGVLLVGEPGNGKTLLAKAVAGEAGVPFFSITGSDFIEVFVGVGAARVRDLFARARRQGPSIIFIDEIDAIGRARGTGFGGGHDEREQTLNQLLTEMDGFESDEAPVIVLAATNMADVLDKALLRPGRFDRRVNVPFPDEKAREEILGIHAREIKLSEDVNLKEIAVDTAGFSGADLANLMNKAAIIASKTNSAAVTMKDIKEAHKQLLFAQSDTGEGSAGAITKTSGKAKMFMPSQVKTKFPDVAGLDEAKEELQDFINYLRNPEQYKRLGAKITNGVLLVGDPGNGKTMLAKAVAGEANVPFFNISGSEFVEKYVGVGASRVRELFEQARKHSPCIIFIDEIDAVGGHRNTESGGNEERNQTLNQLLTEMDGFDSGNNSVIVLAATNRPDSLDKALKRPGRFDREVIVPYPDLVARKKILEVHTKKINLADDVNLEKIARGTPGFSAAEIANLVNEATIIATKKPDQDVVTVADFEEARDKVILGKESKSMILTDEDKKVTAFHESGHALVRLLMPEHSDPLHKLTIIPRGRALGVTHSLPEREKYTSTKEEMIATIMSCLGGRAAEEIVFKILGTGASNDFEKATEIAQKMVRHYGMSENLGPMSYKDQGPYKYSEKTAELIDKEVKAILEECYKKTVDLLIKNRNLLDKLSFALLEKETLFASDVYDLLGIDPREEFKFS